MTDPAGADPTREDPAVLREYYRQMALIRAFELRAAEMYTRARIGGYCHLNLGEEATVVGLTAALRDDDYLFATYREHGYALARGADPGRVMAELFGREDGLSRGRGGSMHLFDPDPPDGRVRDRRRPDPAGDRRGVRPRLPRRPRPGRAGRDVPAG
jgi:pyruvate dehydrogenase E1 component alpha subunit